MSIPSTKTARQAHIRSVLAQGAIRSQAELAARLLEDQVQVTQATLSRDLVELGAARIRDEGGQMRYVLREGSPGANGIEGHEHAAALFAQRLSRVAAEVLVTAESSANLVVLSTPPGAANFLALAIDQASMPEVLGSIAGDDTVMVIARDPQGGAKLAQQFLDLAAHRHGDEG